jgi:hypothetical protein
MKKTFLAFIPVIGFMLFTGGTSAAAQSPFQVDPLDAAIREASNYLNGNIPRGNKTVFLNITSDYPDLSEYILSLLSENAVNDKIFSVVDRGQIDSIRAELSFQMSGDVDDNSARSIGKMLGAQSIVSGAVSKIGSLYRLQVKAINVQTAEVKGQWSKNFPSGSPIIAALTTNFAPAGNSSGTTTVPQRASTTQTPQASSAKSSSPANGTYTFYTRPRGYIGASPAESYISHITVRGDVMYVFITSTSMGPWRAAGSRVFHDRGNIQYVHLQDLDNPGSRPYFPEPGMSPTHSWDRNGEWFTFKGVKGRRFSLTITNESPPLIWHEIILGEPD